MNQLTVCRLDMNRLTVCRLVRVRHQLIKPREGRAFGLCGGQPAVNQIHLQPYFQQRDVQAFDAEHGILTQAWSPLGGITFYSESSDQPSTLDDNAIGPIAAAHSKSPAQVMLRWHVQEGRSAIPKSTKAHRIAENLDVFDFELSADELQAIDALDTATAAPEYTDEFLLSFGVSIPEAWAS